MGLILFMLVLLSIAGAMLWLLYINYIRAPKYNGLVWMHPDHGGGMLDVKRQPKAGQRPFFFKYAWWYLRRHPFYLWQVVKHINPDNGQADYKVVEYEPKKPLGGDITPNELYDNSDWSCARRFETVKSNVTEAIKFGMAIIMVAACVFGIIVLVDMLGKGGV